MKTRKAANAAELLMDVSPKEAGLISQIAAKAVILAKEFGLDYKMMDAEMDLTACHANGNPLRLEELAAADKGNLGHDVFGIRRFLDRTTGKLGGKFTPRFSVRKGRAVRGATAANGFPATVQADGRVTGAPIAEKRVVVEVTLKQEADGTRTFRLSRFGSACLASDDYGHKDGPPQSDMAIDLGKELLALLGGR